jgi:hypothetical protein
VNEERTRNAGRFVGHCPGCGIAVGKRELKKRCIRCGTILDRDELVFDLHDINQARNRFGFDRIGKIRRRK